MKIRRVYRQAVAVVLTVCMICCNLMPAMAAEATATSLRLTETEGTVAVTNNSGKSISVIRDMKLYNGYHVETQEASYAWINLDSTKLTKLDAVSEMEVRQKGRELELMLNSGNLYFNVTAPLADDETLNIRTSTMVTGIRGTCGWVKVIDQYHTLLYVLEGTVQSGVADPVSGQVKTAAIHGGEVAEFVVYPKDKKGDKCDIFLKRYGEEDIDGFVWAELAKDIELCKKIEAESGLNILAWLDKADEKLQGDQAAMHEKLEAIAGQLASQDSNITVDPVWVTNDTDSSSGSGGSSGGGGTSNPATPETPDEPTQPDEPEQPSVVTFTMKVAAQVVHDELQKEAVKEVILLPSSNPADNTLDVDVNVTVPEGKKLTMNGDINMDVQSGQTLQVDGTVDCPGDVTNSGTINVTSSNTLKVGGAFVNNGNINNTSTGRIVAANGITNESGTFSSAGRVEGAVDVSGGTLNITGGEVTGDITHGGGNVNITGGAVHDVVQTDGEIDLDGGIPDTLTMLGGSLTLGQGTLDTELNLKGTSKLTLKGGEITRPVQAGEDAGIRITGGSVAEGITLRDRASLDMSGGSVPEVSLSGDSALTLSGGEIGNPLQLDDNVKVNIAGATVTEEITLRGRASLEISKGTVSAVNVNGGTMRQTGGRIAEVRQTDGEAELGGNVTKTVQSGGRMKIGGTVGAVEQTAGTMEITGGTIDNVQQSGGTAEMTGGTVKNGYQVISEGNFTMNGGTLEVGAAEAALMVGRENAPIPDNCAVTLTSGVVDGGSKYGVQANAGTCLIGKDMQVKAAEAYHTVDFHGGSAEIEISGTEKQEIDGNCIYTCRRADDGELYLTKSWGNSGIRPALENAEAGEIVTMRIEANIGAQSGNGQEVPLDIKEGTEEDPVELDLNGYRFTVSTLNVGPEEKPAALRIFNTGISNEVRGTSFVIGKNGCLIVENNLYGEGMYRKSSLIENNGCLFIQDGAKLEVGMTGWSLLDLVAGSKTVVGTEGSETELISSYRGEEGKPLINIQGDASLSLNNCLIDGSNVNALYIEGGDAQIEINDGAEITSECSAGTVKFAGLNENVAYNGGRIQNDSDAPAIMWTKIEDEGDDMPGFLPDGFETEIRSKSENILVWDGADEANLGYYAVEAGDGYYYVTAEDPEIQTMFYLATPSQLDEIGDEDFWFDDDISDEDEEYINLASPSNASPSNASPSNVSYAEDDEEDDNDYEAGAAKAAMPSAVPRISVQKSDEKEQDEREQDEKEQDENEQDRGESRQKESEEPLKSEAIKDEGLSEREEEDA